MSIKDYEGLTLDEIGDKLLEAEEIKEENQKLEEKISELENEIAELENEIAELENEIAELKLADKGIEHDSIMDAVEDNK